jgi:hypothetical protein
MTVQYIAICYLGAGSVYGQAESYEEAVKIATREALAFAKHFGGFAKGAKPLPFQVYDYRPWESITWADGKTFGYRTKDRSDEPTQIDAERFVWVDPRTGKVTADMTLEQWHTAIAAAALS